MANIELDDNQTQIRDANVQELTIRGGLFYIDQKQLGTSTI